MSSRKYCNEGHELTEDNVYHYDKSGSRRCIKCRTAYQRKYHIEVQKPRREAARKSKPCAA